MSKPTLNEVAAAAGVSLASASRALSGGLASQRMIAKVRAAAREIGYYPDATARALRTGGARRVTFAVDDIGNPNYVSMLRAIEASFGPEGPFVSVTSTGALGHTAEALKQATAVMADGLIISPIRTGDRLRRAIESSPIPVVVIGSLGVSGVVDSVHIDSSRGVGMAVDHIHQLGRRNVAFVNGPLDTNPGSSREHGFFRAVRRLGLDPASYRQVVADDFTVAAGAAAARELFVRWRAKAPDRRIDAVVAANDLIAIGVIRAALDHGIRVPEDVAVTGVDDTEIAAAYNPSLTSVSLFAAQRGALAAELLLKRFAQPSREIQVIEVEPELVVRRSTVARQQKEGER